jgi:hypothetical protein
MVMDVIVALYLVIVIFIVSLSVLNRMQSSGEVFHIYRYRKPRKTPEWQGKFFGKWEKLTRTGFYEVFLKLDFFIFGCKFSFSFFFFSS